MTQSNVPTQPAEPPPEYMLIGKYAKRIRASIGEKPTDTPEAILGDLKKEDIMLVRKAILGTQPPQWGLASPLVDSLQDEQCVGILAALLAVYVQTV